MQIQVMVFWVMTSCSDVVGYHHIGEPYFPHLNPPKWSHYYMVS